MIRFYIFALAFLFVSCGQNRQRDIHAIQELAERHVSELNAPQLLREYILSIDNDTNGDRKSVV